MVPKFPQHPSIVGETWVLCCKYVRFKKEENEAAIAEELERIFYVVLIYRLPKIEAAGGKEKEKRKAFAAQNAGKAVRSRCDLVSNWASTCVLIDGRREEHTHGHTHTHTVAHSYRASRFVNLARFGTTWRVSTRFLGRIATRQVVAAERVQPRSEPARNGRHSSQYLDRVLDCRPFLWTATMERLLRSNLLADLIAPRIISRVNRSIVRYLAATSFFSVASSRSYEKKENKMEDIWITDSKPADSTSSFFWQYDSKWLRALFRISTWFWFFTLFSSEMSIKWWHRRRLGRRWQSCTRTFFHGPPSVYWSSHELLNEKVSFDYATRRFAALFVSTQSQLLIESTLAQSCWLIT